MESVPERPLKDNYPGKYPGSTQRKPKTKPLRILMTSVAGKPPKKTTAASEARRIHNLQNSETPLTAKLGKRELNSAPDSKLVKRAHVKAEDEGGAQEPFSSSNQGSVTSVPTPRSPFGDGKAACTQEPAGGNSGEGGGKEPQHSSAPQQCASEDSPRPAESDRGAEEANPASSSLDPGARQGSASLAAGERSVAGAGGSARCCFCHRSADVKALCGLGLLRRTERQVIDRRRNVVHLFYHEPCAAYGSGMGAIPSAIMDVEDDIIREWNRSAILKCVHCKARGIKPSNRATLGCAYQTCRVSLHYPCARELAREGKIFFAQGPREIVCPKHKKWYLKREGGKRGFQDPSLFLEHQWLGMWMEGSGGWNGISTEAKLRWEAAGSGHPILPVQGEGASHNAEDAALEDADLEGSKRDSDCTHGAPERSAAASSSGRGGPHRQPAHGEPEHSISGAAGPSDRHAERRRDLSDNPHGKQAIHVCTPEHLVCQAHRSEAGGSAGTRNEQKVADALKSLQQGQPEGKAPARGSLPQAHTSQERGAPSAPWPTANGSKGAAPERKDRKPSGGSLLTSVSSLGSGWEPRREPKRTGSGAISMPAAGARPQPQAQGQGLGTTHPPPAPKRQEEAEKPATSGVQDRPPAAAEAPRPARGPSPPPGDGAAELAAGFAQAPRPASSKPHAQQGAPPSPAVLAEGAAKEEQISPVGPAPEPKQLVLPFDQDKRDAQPRSSQAPDGGASPSAGFLDRLSPESLHEKLDSLAFSAVQEWRSLRLVVGRTPVASSVQVLGHSLSKTLASKQRSSFAQWRLRGSTDCGEAVRIVGWDYMAWQQGYRFPPAERSTIESSVLRYTEPFARMCLSGKTLPSACELLPCLQAFYIERTDLRLSLVGQEGLMAGERIPRGTVIGPARCAMMTQEESDRWRYSGSRPLTDDGRIVSQGWWEAVHSAFSIVLDNADVAEAFPWLQDKLVLSMVGDGDALALINDPEIEPLASRHAAEKPRLVARANVLPVLVSFLGIPLVFMVASRDIGAGDELLMRYGRGYWDSLRSRLLSAGASSGEGGGTP